MNREGWMTQRRFSIQTGISIQTLQRLREYLAYELVGDYKLFFDPIETARLIAINGRSTKVRSAAIRFLTSHQLQA